MLPFFVNLEYSRCAILDFIEDFSMSEYLSKEEIKKWRSSVEKITLEEYAARLGKKLQEEKKTNDLADMLYTHYNPMQSMDNYDTITKLEKIDLTPKSSTKHKAHSSKNNDDLFDDDAMMLDAPDDEMFDDKFDDIVEEKEKKAPKKQLKSEPKAKEKVAEAPKKTETKAEKTPAKAEKPKKDDTKKAKAEKAPAKTAKVDAKNDFAELNITFKKNLTDREEKVLSYFVEKRGEIVYAKDLAELLDLKRDYIYKYIKNLRAKMSTDLIMNADNGGFKLN